LELLERSEAVERLELLEQSEAVEQLELASVPAVCD
jgi:hypothetical protein